MAPSVEPKTILLIDDEDSFRMVVREHLQDQGFAVVDTASPKQGLEFYFTCHPDAVVLDLLMPEMPGLEVLERLVEDDPNLPVVVLSGTEDLEDAVTALRLGACDYLNKMDSFKDKLADILTPNILESNEVRDRSNRISLLKKEIRDLDEKRQTYKEKVLDQAIEKKQLTKELEDNKNKVDDMTVTLRTVIKTVDDEKGEIRESIADEVRNVIMPNLEKMVKEDSREVRESLAEVVEQKFFSLVDEEVGVPDEQIMLLTATELDVAQYIKAGRTTAEIADLMHSSLETIQSHRKNIRKKYGLVGKNISLRVFLRSIKGL